MQPTTACPINDARDVLYAQDTRFRPYPTLIHSNKGRGKNKLPGVNTKPSNHHTLKNEALKGGNKTLCLNIFARQGKPTKD